MEQIVVTGANKGIGLELTRQYHARGDAVLAVCRTASPELAELGVEVLEGIDVTDAKAIAVLASKLDDRSIDLLVNNAGLRTIESFEDMDIDRIRYQFEVNALAPLAITHAFSDKLKDAAKVALISSRVGSLADNGRGGEYGYRISKAAINMAGVNLAIDLKPRNIGVFLLHPGFVKTNLTGNEGMTTADKSAAQLIALTDKLTLADTGGFFHANGERLPW